MSKRTPEERKRIVRQVCKAVAHGKSTVQACRAAGISIRVWWMWCGRDSNLLRDYTRAREMCGESYGERVAAVARRVLAGEVDANAGRVAIDAFKWTACHMAPRHWADAPPVTFTEQRSPAVVIGQLAVLLDRTPELRALLLGHPEIAALLPGACAGSVSTAQPPNTDT